MAGRSGAVVPTDSSRRQDSMEHGSSGDVFVWKTVAFFLPGDGAGRTSAVVPVRSENDPAGRRAAVVHSWRGRRCYGVEASGRRVAPGAQSFVSDSGYGGSVGGGSGPRRTHHPV